MNNKNIIYVDGTFRASNKKDVSSRRMIVCILDMQTPSQFQIRGVMRKGGSKNLATLISIKEGMNHAFTSNYKNLVIRTGNHVVVHWVEYDEIKGKIKEREFTDKILEQITGLKRWFSSIEFQSVPPSLNKASVVLDIKTKGRDFI